MAPFPLPSLTPPPPRPTWLEIDLGAIANNVRLLRRLVGSDPLLCGVVKANAYGHGAVPVSQAILAAGVDRLAVAAALEGMELRQAGIQAPILILGYTPLWQAAAVVDAGLTTTIFDLESAQALDTAAAQAGQRAVVHVKVNTGMNRLGVNVDQAGSLLAAISDLPNLTLEGIFTHFHSADLVDKQATQIQLARFTHLLQELETAGLRPPIAHAANSPATLTLPESHLDMVRAGIALYGLPPDDPQTLLPSGFQPALSWKAVIAQVRELSAGEGVSYGHEFVASTPRVIAVIPVGYADGFPRAPRHWQSVLIHGHFAPIVGRVCMDQFMVDVTEIATHRQVTQGDEVVLIGRQGENELTAQEVGRRLGTINYDVVSRILSRVPRLYVEVERGERSAHG